MKTAQIGLALRLIGPAIELLSIGLLISGLGQGRSILGLGVEGLLYFGVALGLAMVALGLGLSIPGNRGRSRTGRPQGTRE